MAEKTKTENNIGTNSIKTLKMVHIKKKYKIKYGSGKSIICSWCHLKKNPILLNNLLVLQTWFWKFQKHDNFVQTEAAGFFF